MNLSELKCCIIAIFSAIAAFLQPIVGDIYTMLLLFFFNAFFGLVADVVHGGIWNKKKFCRAFIECILFLTLVTLIYTIGYFKHNMTGALQCVSFISYVLIYYYGTNICRNMMLILPNDGLGYKAFAFIYSVLSIEIIKHIPFMQGYIKNNRA